MEIFFTLISDRSRPRLALTGDSYVRILYVVCEKLFIRREACWRLWGGTGVT